MSQLLQKSDDSLKACEALIEKPNELFTSSIHHAYYSSLQRSIHVLQTHFPSSLAGVADGASNHVKTIDALKQKLIDGGYRLKAYDYEQGINRLKRNRVQADYKLGSFNEKQSRASLKLAQDLSKLLDEVDTILSNSP